SEAVGGRTDENAQRSGAQRPPRLSGTVSLLAGGRTGPIAVRCRARLFHPDPARSLDHLAAEPTGAPRLSRPRAQRRSETELVRRIGWALREWRAGDRYHRLRRARI